MCALVAGGGYAEYCAAPEPQCLPVPKGSRMVEAAALPETFFTVWHNLFERGRLDAGESVADPWRLERHRHGRDPARPRLRRAAIFATAGSPEKCHACEKLGATRGIDYKHEDFVAVVKEATGRRGVDVMLDMVGGDYIQRDLRASRRGPARQHRLPRRRAGRGQFRARDVKRLTITGSTLRAAPGRREGRHRRALKRAGLAAAGRRQVEPVIYKTFPLAQAAAAHRLMESSDHIGKIVLEV